MAGDPQGNVNTNSSTGPVKIPVGQTISPVTTANVNIGGNLPADSATGTTIDVSIDVNNSLGASIPLRMEFTKVADTAGSVNWTVTTYDSANDAIAGPTNVRFDTAGNLTTGNVTLTQAQLNTIAGTSGTWAAGGATLNFGTATAADRLTGAATLNSVAALSQDGSTIGSLVSFSVGQDGLISGVFSNGRTQALGQIALATFADPAGLLKQGGSLFTTSAELRRRPDRRRRHRRPGHAHRRDARGLERRPRSGVHEHDHRPAWFRGEREGHHDLRPAPPGPREPEAIAGRRSKRNGPTVTGKWARFRSVCLHCRRAACR